MSGAGAGVSGLWSPDRLSTRHSCRLAGVWPQSISEKRTKRVSVLEAHLATKLRSGEEPAPCPPVSPKPVLTLGALGAALIIPQHPTPGILPGTGRATRVGSVPTAAQDLLGWRQSSRGREPPPYPPTSDPPTPPLLAGPSSHIPPTPLPPRADLKAPSGQAWIHVGLSPGGAHRAELTPAGLFRHKLAGG